MKLSILIPTFNEAPTLESLLRRVMEVSLPIDGEIILVDDCSTDATAAILQRLRETSFPKPIRVIRNPANQGKGASIRTALSQASGDWVIVQDGDLECDPEEIPLLLDLILKENLSAVYGSRFLKKFWPTGMAWPHFMANRLLTALANLLYGTRLTDAYTCYKLIRRDLLIRLQMRACGFEWEAEVTAKLGRAKIPIREIPISYQGRTPRAGKKIRARDLAVGIRTLLRYRNWQNARNLSIPKSR